MASLFRKFGLILLSVFLGIVSLWTIGAIYYDGPFSGAPNAALSLLWLGLLIAGLSRFRKTKQRLCIWLAAFLVVFLPWLAKSPSNTRDWAEEFARVPDATVEGDAITITNFRNFDYGPDGKPIPRWETRTVHLSNLKAMDFFMTYWGSDLIGHPMFSFDFGPEGHVVFSIESRREKGETYGVLSGLYKQFELIYIASAESDVVRVRINFRENEDVWLYRLQLAEATPRSRFLEYIHGIRDAAKKPRFYNSITANCTTAVRAQLTNKDRHSLDYRILANGKLDQLFSERHLLVNPPVFTELRKKSHINPAANAHPEPATFSEVIRKGLPGFQSN